MKDEELNEELQKMGKYAPKLSKWATFWKSVKSFLKAFWKENFVFRK